MHKCIRVCTRKDCILMTDGINMFVMCRERYITRKNYFNMLKVTSINYGIWIFFKFFETDDIEELKKKCIIVIFINIQEINASFNLFYISIFKVIVQCCLKFHVSLFPFPQIYLNVKNPELFYQNRDIFRLIFD